MLFSILYISSEVGNRGSKQSLDYHGQTDGSIFFKRASQALVAGGYQKARPYSVEAVLLYAMCKFLFKDDLDTDVWMLIGISARLAIRMGYHRDPSHLANISPFEGEMRRRTFFTVQIFDVLFSFQAGLPAIIQEEEFDTEGPSNLFDTDFNEDSTALPPSRPVTDPTPMLYYCYKNRLGRSFRRVTHHALTLKMPSYEDTMKLDRELHEIHIDIPPSLKLKPLHSSFMDHPKDIMHRLNVHSMYLQCLCVLHRRYLTIERSNPNFDYSRRICVDSALQILDLQAQLYFASQPGGQLYNSGRMSSCLDFHGYLLAAMITCLDMYECYKGSASLSPKDLAAQARKYDALKLSHDVWVLKVSSSRDARRASDVLAAMLAKVPRPPILSTNESQDSIALQSVSSISSSARTTLTPTDSVSWSNIAFNSEDQIRQSTGFGPSGAFPADPLDSMLGEPETINWVSLCYPCIFPLILTI